MARLLRWTSTALIVGGVLLIVLAAGSYGYAAVERLRAEREYHALESQHMATSAPRLPASQASTSTAAPAEWDAPHVLPRGEAPSSATSAPTPGVEPPAIPPPEGEPAALPMPPQAQPPSYAPATRIKLPSAGIDARVVEVGVVDGEFEVPKFAVGHYRHTALPGQPGNGVYAGHVSSISSGDVFANLHRAKAGDEVLLQTPDGVVRYIVSEVRVVPRTAVDVLAPTSNPTITLIACTGAWDWQLRDYRERLVVRAELASG